MGNPEWTCDPMYATRAFRRALSAALFLAAGLLAGPALAQSTPPPDGAGPLRPGDVVRLRIWREPDFSGEFTVDERGEAVLPRIGAVRVAGEDPDALRARIAAEYAKHLVSPSVEVVFLRRVQVLGAVRTPGLYPVDPTMSVADVLALAGGATVDGDARRVTLVRGGERIPVRLSAGVPDAATRLRSGDQLWVNERGWLSRNTGVVTAAVTGVVSLVIAFGTR